MFLSLMDSHPSLLQPALSRACERLPVKEQPLLLAAAVSNGIAARSREGRAEREDDGMFHATISALAADLPIPQLSTIIQELFFFMNSR